MTSNHEDESLPLERKKAASTDLIHQIKFSLLDAGFDIKKLNLLHTQIVKKIQSAGEDA